MIVSANMMDLVSSCKISEDHDLNTSDHLPLIVHVLTGPMCISRRKISIVKFKWDKLSNADISNSYGKNSTHI